MTDHYIKGRSPVGRRLSAGGSWRGLAMTLTPGEINTSGGSPFASVIGVPWSVVIRDSDSIRSTGANSFSSATVAAGGAGVVPAGMAGLWRMSQNIEFQNVVGASGGWAFAMVINDFEFIVGPQQATFVLPFQDTYDVAAWVYELAVGDVVWSFVIGNSTSNKITSASSFLMEYLGA